MWNKQFCIWKEHASEEMSFKERKDKGWAYPSGRLIRDIYELEPWEHKFYKKIKATIASQLEEAWDNYKNPKMPNHKKPKFKSKKDKIQSIDFNNLRFDGKTLLTSKSQSKDAYIIGKIPMAEEIRFKEKDDKKIGGSTISFDGLKWYVTFTFEITRKIRKPNKRKTAIDLNIRHFDWVDENGEFRQLKTITNKIEKAHQRVKHYSRQLSRKTKNSKNYQLTRTKLNRNYKYIWNCQEDLIRKYVKYLCENFNEITIEDLDVKSMMMNKRLAKNLHRSMFGRFRRLLEEKSNIYENNLIVANRFYPSTQRCASCDFIREGEDKLFLHGDRFGNDHDTYVCINEGCNYTNKRDINAILNLLQY